MDIDEMAQHAEQLMEQVAAYAIDYVSLRNQKRKTHQKAKLMRRWMEEIKGWLRAIEIALREDEKKEAEKQ